MAGFEYLIQGQGPTVPISLFSEAATAGINAGNALPTGLAAGIRGAIQGYAQGQEFAANNQRLAANELQMKRQELALQIEQMNLEAAELTKDMNLQIAQQEAKNKLKEAQNQAVDLQNQTLLTDTLNGPNPGMALHDPNLSQYLLRNKEARDYAHISILNNPNVSPQDKQLAAGLADYWKQKEYELQKERVDIAAKQAVLKQNTSVMEAYNDPNISAVANQFNLKPHQLGKIVLYPKGLKNFDKDGNLVEGPDNEQVLGAENTYDVVVDGKKANVIFNDSTKNTFRKAKNYLATLGDEYDAPPGEAAAKQEPAPTTTTAPQPPTFAQRFSNAVTGAAEALIAPSPQGTGGIQGPAGMPNPYPQPPPPPTIATTTDNPVVNQSAQRLLDKARTDPDLMTRLVAKGLVRPSAPMPAPSPGTQAPTVQKVDNGEPVSPTPAPVAVTKKNIADIHAALPESTKKFANEEILFRVAKEPLTSNLNSLQKAVIAVESGGKKNAKNKDSSATGLFQLTNAAAKDVGVDKNNPIENIKGGAAYLDKLLAQYGNEEVPALLAYRLGPAVLTAAIQQVGSIEYDDLMFGLKYLADRGRFKDILTETNLKQASKYPLQVLAYKDAFERLASA